MSFRFDWFGRPLLHCTQERCSGEPASSEAAKEQPAKLGADIAALNAKMDGFVADNEVLRTEMTRLYAALHGLSGGMATLQTNVDAVTADNAALLANMAELRRSVVSERSVISKRDSAIAELDQLREGLAPSKAACSKVMAERDAAIAERNKAITERDEASIERNKANAEAAQLRAVFTQLEGAHRANMDLLRDELVKHCDERDQLRRGIEVIRQWQLASNTRTSPFQPGAAAGVAAPGVSIGDILSTGMWVGSLPSPAGVIEALLSSARNWRPRTPCSITS